MTNQQSQVETIPIRQPDGSFVMVEVGSGQVDVVEQKVSIEPPKPKVESKPILQNAPQKIQDNIPQEINIAKPQDGIDWQASVDKVINSVSIELFDDNARDRLSSIVLSRLRDVRDILATREALAKGRDAGGLGLNEIDVSSVLSRIETEYKIIHNKNNTKSEQKLGERSSVEDLYKSQAKLDALAESDIPYVESNEYMDTIAGHLGTIDQFVTKAEPKEIEALSDIEDDQSTEPEIINSPIDIPAVDLSISLKDDIGQKENLASSFISQSKVEAKSVTDSSADLLVKDSPAPAIPSIRQEVIKPTSTTKSKPTMEDVVSKKRLMGPIDELGSMRLIDFRRLGNSTEERLQKVKEHIEEMEDISFTKKVEAIKAWRSNPIYKMYVQLGSQSLMGSQTVEDVINTKEQAGEEILSREEFGQLTDFNKNLRY